VNQASNQETIIGDRGVEYAALPAEIPGCAGTFPALELAAAIKHRTILLVEDEAFVREVTVQVLKSAGYAVLTASSGAEARHLYDQFCSEIDLLLSDVILPDENGRTLVQQLRSYNAELPALLVTGYAEQVESGPMALVGVECLPKPFSARTLLQTVKTVLDKKRRSGVLSPITSAGDIE